MPSKQVIHAVDDDRLFLSALERSLRSTGLAVLTYASPHAFLDALEPERPGCLITDLRMPGMSGIALQQSLGKRRVRMPIVFVTGHGDTAAAVSAFRGGAVDFLEKPFSEQQLLESVERALVRDRRERSLARDKAVVTERYGRLSPRERQVFRLVVSDRPNKEIARALKISPRTVEHHRQHLMLKMQAASLAELIIMAVLCNVHELRLRDR